MNIDIKKVKITKAERLEVTYKRKDVDKDVAEVTEIHSSAVHPDFAQAMQKLAIHLAILTGYVQPGDIKNLDTARQSSKEVDFFKVSGFAIGGDDEDEGIVIKGHRIVKVGGKAVILNTPFTRFNEAPETRYKFMDDVISCVDDIKIETVAYLGGKFKPDAQQELTFDGPVNEDKTELTV